MLCGTAAPAQDRPEPPLCRPPAGIDAASATEAEGRLRARWLRDRDNWYMAYRIPPPKANPFDLQARKEPPVAEIKGIVWARRMRCLAEAGPEPASVRYRFTAIVISFHEGAEWSPGQRNALLVDLTMRLHADAWQTVDGSAESGVLMAEMEQRRPQAAEIPPPSVALGLPCIGRQFWDGRRCVTRVKGRKPSATKRTKRRSR